MIEVVCPECNESYSTRLVRQRVDRPDGLQEESLPGGGVRYGWLTHGPNTLTRLLTLLAPVAGVVFMTMVFEPPAGWEMTWTAIRSSQGRVFLEDARLLTLLTAWTLFAAGVAGFFYHRWHRSRLEWTGSRLIGLSELSGGQVRQLYVGRDGTLRCQGDAPQHVVLGRAEVPAVLLYLEQELESRLGIDDLAVPQAIHVGDLEVADPCPNCEKPVSPPELKRQLIPEPGDVARPTLTDDGLELKVPWRSACDFGNFLFLTVFWNLFCSIPISQALIGIFSGDLSKLGLFLIPHIWVGLAMIYYCLCITRNTIVLRCRDGQLAVTSGPLWFPSYPKFLSLDNVTQLYVVERTVKNGKHYSLEGRTREGTSLIVLERFDKGAPLRMVEQELERYLGIVNQPVAGEWQ